MLYLNCSREPGEFFSVFSYQNQYQRMSVPSAFLPPAGGVFNAVPSR